MTLTPPKVYPNMGTYSLTIYDLRAPQSAGSLHRERAIWQERSEIEARDADHFILVIQPATGSEDSL
jgi:hypothetical protein